MQKIDGIVLKETRYIAVFVLVLSLVMQAVFAVLGEWNVTVLLGNILSSAAAIFNFLCMGITIQNAMNKEEKDAKTLMRLSQALRTLCLFVVLAFGIALSCFNTIAVIVPLFFPRVAVATRQVTDKTKTAE